MLLKKFIQEHRVDCFIADAVRLALIVTSHEVGRTITPFFRQRRPTGSELLCRATLALPPNHSVPFIPRVTWLSARLRALRSSL